MKISLFLNDYFVNYNKKPMTSQQQLNRSIIQELYNEDDLFILRGEPTMRPDFKQVLDIFKSKKNYILTTHLEDVQKVLDYDRTIPYISINWDGILNDNIRGRKNYTSNLIQVLNSFRSKATIQRINYTISQYNIAFLDVDAKAMKRFMTLYPKMKQPYFNIYQKGYYYNNDDFTWPPFGRNQITMLNKEGVLTQKNFDYLLGWVTKQDYKCTSIQDEVTILPDATVRLCQSHRMIEVLGSLKEKSLKDILEDSKEKIQQAKNCPLREQCWFAHHRKDSYDNQ